MVFFKAKVNGKPVRADLEGKSRIIDLMHKFCVNREAHLVKKNGKLVSELEEVSPRDRVEIFGVVYEG